MTSGQVIRSQNEVQCQVHISIIFMHQSHSHFLTDFFQFFRMCLVHHVVQHIVVSYIADLSSAVGHDFMTLSQWENIQIAPIPKMLEILFCFNTSICINTWLKLFSLLGVLRGMRSGLFNIEDNGDAFVYNSKRPWRVFNAKYSSGCSLDQSA